MTKDSKLPDGRPIIEGETVKDRTVDIDKEAFRFCTFERCLMVYRGKAPVFIDDCDAEPSCTWKFEQGALETIKLLVMMRSQNPVGFDQLVPILPGDGGPGGN